MGDHENPVIALLDDTNAAQSSIRAAARRLIDLLPVEAAHDLEIIIRATERAQGYLRELRGLEHARKRTRG